MNIDNVAALAAQLQQLGFGDMGNVLLKHICFKPDSFTISKLLDKGEDKLQVELFFEMKEGDYFMKCYDAAIQQKLSSQLQEINGIHITSLENKLAGINWKQAFELNEQKHWNAKVDFTNEEAIESVITDLLTLETSEDGKAIAAMLKSKYWNGSNYFEVFGIITAPKSKAEISQRFFIFDGQPGISLDEAYRFLQNKRIEKQMKRKQIDDDLKENDTTNGAENSGSGLLKKKRINNTTKKGKRKATAQ
jgi:hypothetical protein